MAFSTQKDFFYVPFMNEDVHLECKRACVQLKSYDSTIDDRAWAMDEAKQSKFLTDLVTCNTPAEGRGVGLGALACGGAGTTARMQQAGKGASSSAAAATMTDRGLLMSGDSVLECANTTLGNLQAILLEKETLKQQLDASTERLKTASDENRRIKEIMARKYDSSHSKDFYNKIKKLASAGKVTKAEEQELLQIYQKVEDMNKMYEVLQAENSYLKRLVEKLSRRANLDDIKLEPEQSKDVAFLQGAVNGLRKEVAMLRKMEDCKLQQQLGGGTDVGRLSERDTENLKAIIRERNALREKCKTFKDLEKKVQELQRKTKAADNLSDSLSSNLDNQSKYIGNMETEMKRMQNYYEDEMQQIKYNEELLKCQLEGLKEELMRAKCEAQRSELLQMEVGVLRNELTKREVALSDYDCQYKQLMAVIDELQSNMVQSLKDTHTQTCDDVVEDLAFFASATLEEIMKELSRRKGAGDDTYSEMYAMGEAPRGPDSSYGNTSNFSKPGQAAPSGTSVRTSPAECAAELGRLQKLIGELQAEKGHAQDCEALCADALNKLKAMEAENGRLRGNNQQLQKNNTERLDGMAARLGALDKDVERNAQDTAGMNKNLRESLQLVKDISDIQLKNQQLANAVVTINTKDEQKSVEDLRAQLEALRRQLRDEQEKNKKCQEDNERLIQELQKRGIDVESLLKEPDGGSRAVPPSGKPLTPGVRHSAPAFAGATAGLPIGATPKGVEPSTPGTVFDGPEDGQSAPLTARQVGGDVSPKAGVSAQGGGAGGPGSLTGRSGSPPGRPSSARGGHKGGMGGGTKSGGGQVSAAGSPHSGRGKRPGGGAGGVGGDGGDLDDFVEKNAPGMGLNLRAGSGLEKELRKILEAFIRECSVCFLCKCRCVCNKVPKSKFLAICQKMWQQGITVISFRELVYAHKKIYLAADKLHPGCLLNIILSEQAGPDVERLKCCSCKNILCCDNSEEMLREKVYKLERDIETAREYLEHLQANTSTAAEETYRADGCEKKGTAITFRQAKPSPRCSTKQLKQLKARILKCSECLR